MLDHDYILQLHIDKTNAINHKIDAFFNTAFSRDPNQDVRARELKNALDNLAELVPKVELRPVWLNAILKSVTESEQSKPPQRQKILTAVSLHRAAILAHDWQKDANKVFADPEEIYKYYKSQSQLSALADTVSRLLRELLESEELAEEASANLVQQIRSALDASESIRSENISVTNTGFYIDFLKSVGRNIVKANLEEAPVLGPTIAGYNKAVEEMGIENSGLISKVKKDIAARLPKGIDVPLLGDEPSNNHIDSEVEEEP